MYFTMILILARVTTLVHCAPILEHDTHEWMRNRMIAPVDIVKIPCNARASPCKKTYSLNGYFLEEGEVCYNRGKINYFETCYNGDYNPVLPLHPSFSKFGGHRFLSCDDVQLQNISLVGIQQTKYTSSPFLISESNSERISYSHLREGFMGILYTTDTRMCIDPDTAIRPEVELSHGIAIQPKCVDGILNYVNSECEVVVNDQKFTIPACDSVKLPTYDDIIEVCDKSGCQNVTCEKGEVCSGYHKMDFVMRLKNYQCSDSYRYSLYFILILCIVTISLVTITIINILFFLRPAFWLLKKILYALVGCCSRKMRVSEVAIDMSTVRIVKEEEEGILVVEDSIAPNTNVEEKTIRKGRRVENGLIYVPFILLVVGIISPAESCQDLVSSISNVEKCTNGSCDFVTKMQLSLMNTPQDFCFKTARDVYKIRFNSIKILCLSVPIYYTNSFKRVISKEDWKCFEGEGCTTNGKTSIWSKSQSLSFDYCTKDFNIFSYCPAYHYNWKRIEYEPTSTRACTIMKCKDTKFEINGYIQKNGFVLSELNRMTSKYDNALLSISLSSYNDLRMPREYAECDGKAYVRTANDLGSFNRELIGHIQCPTKEDAVTLSNKCETKILSDEDLPKIRYVERDGIDMLEHVKSEPLKNVIVTQSGIALDTLDLYPVTLNLQFKETVTSIITSKITLNDTTCSITGVERKFKKTKINISTSHKISLSDILSCDGLAVCPVLINNMKTGECITTTYYSVELGSPVKCRFMYSGDTIMCKYNVSPLEITVISPGLDVSSMESIKNSATDWGELLASIIRENPRITLVASIIPIGLVLKTLRGFMNDIRQVD
nr:membrane glycoprotein [wheat yellows virus]